MTDVRQWIVDYLAGEGKTGLDDSLPLFRQIDSFTVVGFLMACDERFHCFDTLSADQLTQLNLDQAATLIASHARSA
ncbi:hypothetical protein [uncultured Aquitalea sp.]|uniref:hypothetical protein n=1 Tax=uncultured Aquitalea sp. TaxID=540272 RepID=UPI0025E9D90B|nr:hypothetical protein [uncultured Aquitalea sp.]